MFKNKRKKFCPSIKLIALILQELGGFSNIKFKNYFSEKFSLLSFLVTFHFPNDKGSARTSWRRRTTMFGTPMTTDWKWWNVFMIRLKTNALLVSTHTKICGHVIMIKLHQITMVRHYVREDRSSTPPNCSFTLKSESFFGHQTFFVYCWYFSKETTTQWWWVLISEELTATNDSSQSLVIGMLMSVIMFCRNRSLLVTW